MVATKNAFDISLNKRFNDDFIPKIYKIIT